jgi:seryl-tRNA synthetase
VTCADMPSIAALLRAGTCRSVRVAAGPHQSPRRCCASFKKPQIDTRAIAADPTAAVANVAARRTGQHVAEAVPRIVDLHSAVVDMQARQTALRTERKRLGKRGGKGTEAERAATAEQGKRLKSQLHTLEATLQAAETEMVGLAAELPNSLHPAVPIGGEEANVLLGTSCQRGGAARATFGFAPKNHIELGSHLGLFDFTSAAVVSGSKFVYLTGQGALLELALVNYAMQTMAARGYSPVLTPDLVKQSVVSACGFAPRGPHTQIYTIEGSDLALAATAEAPLAGMFAGKRIAAENLPIKKVGFGHCFRTEVGARGADVRGLYRLHQFSKVELFAVTTPAQSESILEELLGASESLLQELGLAYRVLEMASQELGSPAHRKYDIEAWMPCRTAGEDEGDGTGKARKVSSVGRYGEVASISNCTVRLNASTSPLVRGDFG